MNLGVVVIISCEFCRKQKSRKLKGSLDDAMNAHKKAMDDNERLLNDLKKANDTIRVSYERTVFMSPVLSTPTYKDHFVGRLSASVL